MCIRDRSSPIERSADPQEASGGADSACPGPVDSPEQSVIDATDESDGDESLGGDDMALLQEKALHAQKKQGRTMGEWAAPGDTPGEGMNSVGSEAGATHDTGREMSWSVQVHRLQAELQNEEGADCAQGQVVPIQSRREISRTWHQAVGAWGKCGASKPEKKADSGGKGQP